MIDKEFIPRIIELLPKIIEEGPEKAKKQLKEIGLCDDHIQEVLEDINHASGRIPLLKMGMKKSQFGGDFDESLIFQEAINLFLES